MTKRSPLFILNVALCLSSASCDDPSPDEIAAEGSTSSADEPPITASDSTSGSDPGVPDDDTSASSPGTSGSTSAGDADTDESSTGDVDTEGETTGETACGDDVPCEDAIILDLGLVSGSVSAGAVTNTPDGGGWTTAVDATAGGIVDAPSNPWIYLQFTDDGLQKIELDDIEALTSQDWDIAAKRFGIRLNSGSSGSGCVTVATIVDDDYDSLDAVPDDATFRAEAFYDDSCGLVDDGSGAGGANYALTPWWFYPGCVGVSYVPFVIETGEGRHVKFMVESYYESGQAECNDSGAMGSGSANFTWRWAYLD